MAWHFFSDMKFLPRTVAGLATLSLVLSPVSGTADPQASPKSAASTAKPVIIRSVRALPEGGGAAVEVISSRPLVPAISKLENPPRLVIDLPNALLFESKKTVDFRSDQINGIRMNQFQQSPPVARIVVDLAKPIAYTWDAAGNRLMVRMHASEPPPGSTSVPTLTRDAQPAAVALRSGSSTGVLLAGNRVPAGSSVTAGFDAAVLRLARGGEVRVCPGTTVSVTSSQNGRSLLLGMNTGALEAHYPLDASSDSILTPDFRILLTGPGEFHYGVTADSRGNTCIQALPGNTASVIVAELLGDGTYQVKPTQQVMFRAGRLNTVDNGLPSSCGCPPAMPAIMRASETPAVSEGKPSSHLQLTTAAGTPAAVNLGSSTPAQAMGPGLGPETASLPPSKSNDVHVQVEAPFVFSARDLPPARPAPTGEVRLLPLRGLPPPTYLQTTALPPSHIKPARHGLFGKIKGFFAAIFG
ncbi:MAG: AMIN domain-containing protein [Acidobacteriia bacterium]|nr:AMIN domain-containing protein [Terriglobia bacterium]